MNTASLADMLYASSRPMQGPLTFEQMVRLSALVHSRGGDAKHLAMVYENELRYRAP